MAIAFEIKGVGRFIVHEKKQENVCSFLDDFYTRVLIFMYTRYKYCTKYNYYLFFKG